MTILSYKDANGDCHWPKANVGSAKFYGVEWGAYLTAENDTINDIAWTVPTGLTGSDDSQVVNQTRIKLTTVSAGDYEVLCQISTVEAGDTQIHIQKMHLKVE